MVKLSAFPSIKLLFSDEPIYTSSVFAAFYDKCKTKNFVNDDITIDSSSPHPQDESGNYCLELELPGIKKENIVISVKDNLLEIKAERKDGSIHIDRKYTLSPKVDADKISAKLEDGILMITLPSKNQEKEKSKIINIE